MVVDDLNQAWSHVTLMPDETDAPLVVDPDTLLPLSVARQPLKSEERMIAGSAPASLSSPATPS
jgi:hypothetical protein